MVHTKKEEEAAWPLMPRHPHIFPPIFLLCDHISGISQSIIAEKLGLDSAKYKFQQNYGCAEFDEVVMRLISFQESSIFLVWAQFQSMIGLWK